MVFTSPGQMATLCEQLSNSSKRMRMFKTRQSTKGKITLMKAKSSQFIMHLLASYSFPVGLASPLYVSSVSTGQRTGSFSVYIQRTGRGLTKVSAHVQYHWTCPSNRSVADSQRTVRWALSDRCERVNGQSADRPV
jgi:hypothetical protein